MPTTTPLGLLITCSIGAAAALFLLSEPLVAGGGGLSPLLPSSEEDALAGLSYAAAQIIPPARLRRLRQALRKLSQALEEFEQALGSSEQQPHEEEQEEEGSIDGAAAPATRGEQLLSMREVCQELGMSKSWVYRRIRSKDIPSIKLGHNIKVRRQDLEEYLRKAPRYRSPQE